MAAAVEAETIAARGFLADDCAWVDTRRDAIRELRARAAIAQSIRAKVEPGSVPLALEHGTFKSLHLFELPEVMERLEFFLASRYTIKRRRKIHTHVGDVNVELPRVLASGVIARDRTCFAFVDPNSTEIDWDTIAELAGYKSLVPNTKLCKVEMWILVNTGHELQRMWPRDRSELPPADVAKSLDRVMGGRSAWKDLFVSGQSSTQLAYRYAERLQSEFGYLYAVPHKIRRNTSSSKVQYFMVHATDHPAAIDFMTWAEKNRSAGAAEVVIEVGLVPCCSRRRI